LEVGSIFVFRCERQPILYFAGTPGVDRGINGTNKNAVACSKETGLKENARKQK
jgi:hypothetical protein